MARLERHLATILCADVKDYSRLMQADEEATIRCLHEYRTVIDAMILDYGGRIANTAGDSVVAEFASVFDAVTCAVKIQEHFDGDAGLSYRIGIHLGDVVAKGQDILGDSVNIAARLEGIADAGGICISGIVFDSVKGKSPYQFEAIGEKQLKNIAEPILVYKLIKQQDAPKSSDAVYPELPDKPSIAVLPLDNMSSDPEQEYFSDGLTEDIITDLSKVSGLFVIARNSTFAYKKQAVDLRRVGAELGVKYLLEGSVRKGGDRVRITVQLIEAANGSHVWAERYDRVMTDIFDLQDEITHTIVSALAVKLTKQETALIEMRDTENIAAYDLLMRGRETYFRFTRESVSQAREIFQQVIELDPGYVQAYVLKAHTYIYDFIAGYVPYELEYLELAYPYLSRALEVEPRSARALAALGWFYIWHGEPAKGVIKLQEALSFEPNMDSALNWISYGYTSVGQCEKGIEFADTSLRQNPKAIVVPMHALACAQYALEQFDECAASCGKALEQNRNFLPALVFLAASSLALEWTDDANRAAQEIRRISPNFHVGMCNLFSREMPQHEKLNGYMASLGFSKLSS